MSTTGEKIKRTRMYKGLTQEELGQILGVSTCGARMSNTDGIVSEIADYEGV